MSDEKSLVVNNTMGIDKILRFADVFQKSGRFATERDVNQIAVKIQAGLELGLQPIQAMNNINVISGKITLGASLIAALIKSSGKYNYRIKVNDGNSCVLEFYEMFMNEWSVVGESSFTMDDAKAAGLVSKDVWKKFPRNMLFSRALTNGARWFCPDVFGGPIYTPDELDNNDTGPDIIVEESEKQIQDMNFDEFASKVRREISETLTDEDIKDSLKVKFSWVSGNKQEMFDYLKNKYDASIVVEGEYETSG